MEQPICTVMVGLPATGKSTRVRAHCAMNPDLFVYSTDSYIDAEAEQQGRTYSEVFSETIGAATAAMELMLAQAMQERLDIVWDQTNLSRKKRARIVQRLRAAGYEVQCEYFRLPATVAEHQTWQQRLHSRPGKHIPTSVIDSMMRSYEQPTVDEGFSAVYCFSINGDLDQDVSN